MFFIYLYIDMVVYLVFVLRVGNMVVGMVGKEVGFEM